MNVAGQRVGRSALVLAVALGTTIVGLGGTAYAGYPTCTTWEKSYYVYQYVKWPINGTTKSDDCIMGQGSTSSAVSALQDTLKRCYGKSIVVDGIFGSATKSALVSVQSQEHVTADGIYGPQTRDVLNWAEYDASSNAFVWCEGA